jgi:putative transposase
MVERPGKDLSVRRQCTLFNLARSGIYGAKPITGADDLALMRSIDELHLELPFYGSRRMIFERNKEGRGVNRKRVQRLMRVMGIEALVPRPGTSKAAPGHKTKSLPPVVSPPQSRSCGPLRVPLPLTTCGSA